MQNVYVQTGDAVEFIYPGAVAFVGNSTQSFDLNVNSVIEELHLKLSGTLTLAGQAAPGTVHPEGLENLIGLVELVANSKESGRQAVSMCRVDAAFLRQKTALVNGTEPDRVDVDGANGAYQFETNFTKFFGAVRNEVGGLTFLDARRLQSLKLNITFRDASAIIAVGGGGTATLSNVKITVSQKERQGSEFAKVTPYIRESMRVFDLSNLSGLDQVFRNIPVGNRLIRQVVKTTAGANAFSDPNNGIVSTNQRIEGAHVKTLIYGRQGAAVTRFDDEWNHIQTKNRNRYKLEAWPDGYIALDYSTTGRVDDLLDLRGVLSAENRFDITTVNGQTNTLTIYDEELVAA